MTLVDPDEAAVMVSGTPPVDQVDLTALADVLGAAVRTFDALRGVVQDAVREVNRLARAVGLLDGRGWLSDRYPTPYHYKQARVETKRAGLARGEPGWLGAVQALARVRALEALGRRRA